MWRAKLDQIGIIVAALAILSGIFFFQDLFAAGPALRPGPTGIPGLHALLDRLVRAGTAIGRQRPASQRAAHGFPLGLLPDGAADLHPMVRARPRRCFGTAALFAAGCVRSARFRNSPTAGRGYRNAAVPRAVRRAFSALWRSNTLSFSCCSASRSVRSAAEQAAEVEPFKTAIILHFVRTWPFVAFAVAMLPGSFIERFYCRYVCPLGAALAFRRACDVRLAQALPRMRQSLPALRERMPRAGDPSRRTHQSRTNASSACTARCSTTTPQKCPVMIQRRLKRHKQRQRHRSSMCCPRSNFPHSRNARRPAIRIEPASVSPRSPEREEPWPLRGITITISSADSYAAQTSLAAELSSGHRVAGVAGIRRPTACAEVRAPSEGRHAAQAPR